MRDLGVLQGDVLVFGGPYSNAQATRAVLAEAERRGIGGARLICTGDVVAYGAAPAETVAMVRASGAAVVAGNVELQLAAGAGDCGCGFAEGSVCDRLSAGWYGHADAAMGAGDRAWMAALPGMVVFSHAGRRCAVIHGGARDVARFLWPVSPEADFAEEVAAIEAAAGPVDRVIAGHSGIPFVRQVAGVEWINAGVIGMPPHDGGRAGRYAVLSGCGVEILPLDYDAEGASAAMRDAGLEQGYDRALLTGYWPSEDVLPPSLRVPEGARARG